MSRFRHMDVLVEMIELSLERLSEIRQRLVYYRASVYKDETVGTINGTIDGLRILGTLLGDDQLVEAFKDYDAMSKAGAMAVVPGECSFSVRVACLMLALDRSLSRMHNDALNRSVALAADTAFEGTIMKHRNQLVALCRAGSRQWTFFQSL